MASATSLVFNIVGNNQTAAAISAAGSSIEGLGDKVKKFGLVAAAGAAAAAVGITALAVDFSKAAMEDQESAAKLVQTMQKTQGATKAQVAATEDWISSMGTAYGVADDDLRPALSSLMIAGRTTAQSQSDVAVAMDIAAAKGVDLASVTNAMAKASMGNTGALGKLGIATKDAEGNALTYEQVLANAAKTMGGAAAAAADTTAGRFKRLSLMVSELKEGIGYYLLPILTTLAGFLLDKVIPAVQGAVDILFKGDYTGGLGLEDGKLVGFLLGIHDAVVKVIDAFTGAGAEGGAFGFFERLGAVAAASGSIVGKALMALGKSLWSWIKPQIQPALIQMGEWVAQLGQWIWNSGMPLLGAALAAAGVALYEWIQPMVMPALAQLGAWIAQLAAWVYNTGLPLLGNALKGWGAALWAWIQPMIVPALVQLGLWVGQFIDWVAKVGLPALLGKLKEWGAALINWIAPMIPPLLGKLGEFLGTAVGWLIGTGIPLLVGALIVMAYELVKWVLPQLPGLLANLLEFIGEAAAWLLSTGLPMLAQGLFSMASSAISSFWQAIQQSPLYQKVAEIFENVKSTISGKIDDIITYFTGLPERIATAASGMWDGIGTAFKSTINKIIGWWNNLSLGFDGFTLHIPMAPDISVPGFSIGTPDIPYLSAATGAFLSARPGGYMVNAAEAGSDEVISPVPMLEKIVRDNSRGGGITVIVNADVIAGPESEAWLVSAIRKAVQSRGGNVSVLAG